MTRLRTHSWLRSAATVALLAAPALALAAPIWAQPKSSRSTGTPLACFLPLC